MAATIAEPLSQFWQAWTPAERVFYQILLDHGMTALRGPAVASLFLSVDNRDVKRPIWIAEFDTTLGQTAPVGILSAFNRNVEPEYKLISVDGRPCLMPNSLSSILPMVIFFVTTRYRPQSYLPLDAGSIAAGQVTFPQTPERLYLEALAEPTPIETVDRITDGGSQLEYFVKVWYASNLATIRARYTRTSFVALFAPTKSNPDPLELERLKASLPAALIGRIQPQLTISQLEPLLVRLADFELTLSDRIRLATQLLQVVESGSLQAVGLAADMLMTL